MKTTIQLLAGLCALTLVACGSDSSTLGSAEAGLDSFPAEQGKCGPEDKIDESGDQKDLCDEGDVATVICVKAGTMCFCATETESNGCYDFNLEEGSVTRVGSGRDCKGISHTEFSCEEGSKCPDSTECTEDKDCAADEVCGDGCCEPEPPKCPLDQKECMDSKDCASSEMCLEGCCVLAPK
jgi:hypothetical protein